MASLPLWKKSSTHDSANSKKEKKPHVNAACYKTQLG